MSSYRFIESGGIFGYISTIEGKNLMSSAIIAIVGRPNVGKSTLFNRVLGFRDAIVHDVPGVTRDRKYAEAEWAGNHFTIIDTGGFVPVSDDVFDRAIREQAAIAIEEADAVVFVVDASTGLTPLDQEIANILRKSRKPIYLTVNKIDSAKRAIDANEFYELGLGDPITISGKYFGSKKGKVYLGYVNVKNGKYTEKNCSVSSWPTDPTKEEGEIVFVVPNLPIGSYDVIVTNSVSSTKLSGGFVIE